MGDAAIITTTGATTTTRYVNVVTGKMTYDLSDLRLGESGVKKEQEEPYDFGVILYRSVELGLCEVP